MAKTLDETRLLQFKNNLSSCVNVKRKIFYKALVTTKIYKTSLPIDYFWTNGLRPLTASAGVMRFPPLSKSMRI